MQKPCVKNIEIEERLVELENCEAPLKHQFHRVDNGKLIMTYVESYGPNTEYVLIDGKATGDEIAECIRITLRAAYRRSLTVI